MTKNNSTWFDDQPIQPSSRQSRLWQCFAVWERMMLPWRWERREQEQTIALDRSGPATLGVSIL